MIEGAQALILDNAYISLSVKFGVVILALICIDFVWLTVGAMKRNDYALVICIVIIVMFSLMENGFFDIRVNWTMQGFGRFFVKE